MTTEHINRKTTSPRMRWGYAGVFREDLEIHKGDPVRNKLEFMVRHGFDSTGMGMRTLRDPDAARGVYAFCERHGLRLTLHPPVRFLDPDNSAVREAIRSALKLLAETAPKVNCPLVTFGGGPVHRFMKDPDMAWQMNRLAELLPEFVEGCGEIGIRVGIENHGDYYCSDLVELCERVPGLGIFLDTGNCFLIGEKPVPACAAAAPFTVGTHFKDHCVHPDLGELKFVIEGAVLGHGHVGLREIYTDLIERAPDPADLVMQWELVPPPGMPSLECIEKSWEFIRTLPDPAPTGNPS